MRARARRSAPDGQLSRAAPRAGGTPALRAARASVPGSASAAPAPYAGWPVVHCRAPSSAHRAGDNRSIPLCRYQSGSALEGPGRPLPARTPQAGVASLSWNPDRNADQLTDWHADWRSPAKAASTIPRNRRRRDTPASQVLSAGPASRPAHGPGTREYGALYRRRYAVPAFASRDSGAPGRSGLLSSGDHQRSLQRPWPQPQRRILHSPPTSGNPHALMRSRTLQVPRPVSRSVCTLSADSATFHWRDGIAMLLIGGRSCLLFALES